VVVKSSRSRWEQVAGWYGENGSVARAAAQKAPQRANAARARVCRRLRGSVRRSSRRGSAVARQVVRAVQKRRARPAWRQMPLGGGGGGGESYVMVVGQREGCVW